MPRKPLPISLNADTPPQVRTKEELAESIDEIEEKLDIASVAAADALLEIIEDEDHKDRYNASLMVLKRKGILRDHVEDGGGSRMASKDVLELVKQIGQMFQIGDAKPVEDAVVVEVEKDV